MLYGTIDPDQWWGDVSATDVIDQLRAITAPTINLRINSGGGDVFDAIAIHQALVDHPATVIAQVDSLAASAASFIAQAGDERVMGRYSKMMIHNASGIAFGNADAMDKAAALLRSVDATISAIYADRSGQPEATFRAAMAAETWYTPQGAVDAGLADRVATPAADPGGEEGGAVAYGRGAALRDQLIRARARARTRG